jgi:predicted metal-binding protein
VITINDLSEKLKDFDSNIKIYNIEFNQIVFENRVGINCFYCSKYNTKWTCPPRIPNVDYKNVLKEYDNIAIVAYTVDINEVNFDELRSKTTNKVHQSLLMLEKYLWENNKPLAISFIGGCCKLCKDGCSKDECKNKGLSRIPIEGIGINVVSTLKNINIDVVFPIKNNLSRYGMILW